LLEGGFPGLSLPGEHGVVESSGNARDPDATAVEGDGEHIDALPAGSRVGKYEILGVLGQGGFGITYRGRDPTLKREVAIKEFLPVFVATRQNRSQVLPRSTHVAEDFRWGRSRFLEEARTLATLTGTPGIVDVFDFIEDNGTAYTVMALARGETLESLLRREGRLPQSAIEQMLPPLLSGLERVHQAGFLHRDIKPGNILIDGDRRPTLIDFGASRGELQDRTRSMTAVYTPGYAPFEQIASEKQGAYSDIYALAATLYHCVTGAAPPSASRRMTVDDLVPASLAARDRYAPTLLAAIDAGLALRAADRPRSIADWRVQFAGVSPSAKTTPVRQPPAPEPVPRRPVWRMVALAAALLIAIGVAVFAVRERNRAEAERQRIEQENRRIEEERVKAETEARRLAEERARIEAERRRLDDEARRRVEDEARARAAAAERERQAREAAVLAETTRIAGTWSLAWRDQFGSHSGTLEAQRVVRPGLIEGRVTINAAAGITVTQDARIAITGNQVTIECSNPSDPIWSPDRFFLTLSADNNRLAGYSLDLKNRRGEITFTRR